MKHLIKYVLDTGVIVSVFTNDESERECYAGKAPTGNVSYIIDCYENQSADNPQHRVGCDVFEVINRDDPNSKTLVPDDNIPPYIKTIKYLSCMEYGMLILYGLKEEQNHEEV